MYYHVVGSFIYEGGYVIVSVPGPSYVADETPGSCWYQFLILAHTGTEAIALNMNWIQKTSGFNGIIHLLSSTRFWIEITKLSGFIKVSYTYKSVVQSLEKIVSLATYTPVTSSPANFTLMGGTKCWYLEVSPRSFNFRASKHDFTLASCHRHLHIDFIIVRIFNSFLIFQAWQCLISRLHLRTLVVGGSTISEGSSQFYLEWFHHTNDMFTRNGTVLLAEEFYNTRLAKINPLMPLGCIIHRRNGERGMVTSCTSMHNSIATYLGSAHKLTLNDRVMNRISLPVDCFTTSSVQLQALMARGR